MAWLGLELHNRRQTYKEAKALLLKSTKKKKGKGTIIIIKRMRKGKKEGEIYVSKCGTN